MMINDNLGSEELSVEYKQIIIPQRYWSELSLDLLRTCVLDDAYDKAVKSTLATYFKKYIPKYVASMSRTSGRNMAKLMFGINDDGRIIGFPTKTRLNIDDVCEMLRDSLKNVRGVHNGVRCDRVKHDYLNEITVELSDISPPASTTNLDSIIANIEMEQACYDQIMMEYHISMMEWRKDHDFYCQALETLCNDPPRRRVFTEYCRKKRAPRDILARLESDEVITFEIGVTDRKKDVSSMEYYITEFKDYHVDRIKNSRPQKPRISSNDDALVSLLAGIDVMNGHWTNAHYQIVTIHLPMNSNPSSWIEYKCKRRDEWISCVRVNSARGDPCCERV